MSSERVIEVNVDYFEALSHDEQVVLLVLLMRREGIRKDDVRRAGISLRKFTAALSSLSVRGYIFNERGAVELGKMTWRPIPNKPFLLVSNENKRIMTEDVLFSSKLSGKNGAKLVFFYINDGSEEVFFYRKRIEALLKIPVSTAKWNVKTLNDSGHAVIKRKEGSQGLIATFPKKKRFAFNF